MRPLRVRTDHGFSMLEMIATMLVATVLINFSAPYVNEFFDTFDKRNAEMQIIQDMRLAQAKSVEQGCQGILVFVAGSTTYRFGCDYATFSVTNPPTWDSVLFTRQLPTNIRATSDSTIVFNTRGQAIDYTGSLVTRTVTLSLIDGGSQTVFNTGTLRPTGFFAFNS